MSIIFELHDWRRMEKTEWPKKVTNEEVLEHIGEKKMVLNNILHRKSNGIGHILRGNYLLHDVIEGQMTGLDGAGEEERSFSTV